jgi:hypothetical protein
MISHCDRRLGMSDATIEPFKGMVDCGGPPSDPAQLRDITRICEEVLKERARTPDGHDLSKSARHAVLRAGFSGVDGTDHQAHSFLLRAS